MYPGSQLSTSLASCVTGGAAKKTKLLAASVGFPGPRLAANMPLHGLGSVQLGDGNVILSPTSSKIETRGPSKMIVFRHPPSLGPPGPFLLGRAVPFQMQKFPPPPRPPKGRRGTGNRRKPKQSKHRKYRSAKRTNTRPRDPSFGQAVAARLARPVEELAGASVFFFFFFFFFFFRCSFICLTGLFKANPHFDLLVALSAPFYFEMR